MTDEAMVEAVARAICTETYGRCTCAEGYADYRVHCDDAERSARAAICAVSPLLIEQCAEVARRHAEEHARSLGAYGAADVDSGRGRQEGHIDAGNTIAQIIRALNHFGDADEMVGDQTRNAVLKKEA